MRSLRTLGPRSVSELLEELSALLDQGFRRVLLRAEISSLTRSARGHLYLGLKDDRASLDAVIWSRTAARLGFEPEVGMEVLVEGSLEVYPPRGRLQLKIEHLEPAGRGAAQLAYEQLKARLSAEGLFEPSAKKALPRAPRRIGLVTSKQAAALRDMLEILRRDLPFEVLLAPCLVQGPGAAKEIAAALERLDAQGMDVILLARGGGSQEDLWAFNEEPVARAVAACQTPVLTGIGHETDTSIADLVADQRAATPTHAAELVVARTESVTRRLELDSDRLERLLQHRLEKAAAGLEHLVEHRAFRALPHRLALLDRRLCAVSDLAPRLRRRWRRGDERLESLRGRLVSALRRRPDEAAARRQQTAILGLRSAFARRLASAEGLLAASIRAFELLDPQRVLERGYSITSDQDGTVLLDPASAAPGSRLQTRLARGMLSSVVVGPSRPRRAKPQPTVQPSLFEEDQE